MLPRKKEPELELKKHVNAIHCSNNFSLIQRKLFNALLFNAYGDLPHKNQFQISAKALCQLIGYNSNDHAKVKKALLDLMRVTIEWNVINDETSGGEGKWRASTALAAAKMDNGMCSYEYSSILKELLYHPAIYGRLDMKLLAKFNSSYGLALYENCVRFQGLPYTPWFTLASFRKLMGVLDEKYPLFKDFKKRVLNMALAEMNAYSPMKVEVEIKREQQKVTDLRFKLLLRPKAPTAKVALLQSPVTLANTLQDVFGLTDETCALLMQKYDLAYIQEKVSVIQGSDNFKAGKIRGLGGYLLAALKKDYQCDSAPQKNFVSPVLSTKQPISSVNSDDLSSQHYQRLNDIVDAFLMNLEGDRKIQIFSAFAVEIQSKNPLIFGWWQKQGLAHRGVKVLFNEFLLQREVEVKKGFAGE